MNVHLECPNCNYCDAKDTKRVKRGGSVSFVYVTVFVTFSTLKTVMCTF